MYSCLRSRGYSGARDLLRISASTSPQCPVPAEVIDGAFKLTVDASPYLLPIKSNLFVRLDGCPFKNSAFPCVIGPGRQRQSESLADLYGGGRKEPTRRFLANVPQARVATLPEFGWTEEIRG
ncbi:MAG: hypothetical protein JWQ42_1159 [Edaphobacter sp.]|nr:hypothetical protein [Edaphobacter sp.]